MNNFYFLFYGAKIPIPLVLKRTTLSCVVPLIQILKVSITIGRRCERCTYCCILIDQYCCSVVGINSMQVVNIRWSAVLTWGYPDGILRLKHRQKQPSINLIQSEAHQQVTYIHIIYQRCVFWKVMGRNGTTRDPEIVMLFHDRGLLNRIPIHLVSRRFLSWLNDCQECFLILKGLHHLIKIFNLCILHNIRRCRMFDQGPSRHSLFMLDMKGGKN